MLANKFITFEGIDGSGKTTQIKLLEQWFVENGHQFFSTREPGGGKIGEKVRQILKEEDINDGITNLILIIAGRRDNIENIIKPNLAKGSCVICDRFIDSTIAYQNILDNIPQELILELHKLLDMSFWPDITFFLDVDPAVAKNRINARMHSDYAKNDDLALELKQKLRQSFLKLTAEYPQRIKIIDANNSPEKIHQQIVKYLVS
ncbi:MAG: dTMP kinase [Rickettsiaceae bacterium]|nr:dTMP kinase [Rickettsiaceae bacterium]